MALNFGLLGDAGAPAMGYLQGQQDVTRNQLAQQQIETGRMTQDKMRMEMDAMKRRQAGLDQFMQKAKELGVDGDPEQLTQVFYEHAISTGDMQQVQAAQIARQAAKERKEYMASQPSAGGAVATPVPMTNNLGTALPAAGAPPMPFSAGAAPVAAPPQGNALGGNRLSQIENRLLELRRFPTAGEKERTELIKERDRLMTPHVVGKNLISGSGAPLYTAPVEPTAPKMHVVGKNLVDETGKVVFKAQPEPGAGVPKAPAGYRVTAAGDLEAIPGGPAASKPMTALQQQAYKKDFANDTSNIKSAVDTANELETLTDTLVGNPDKGIKAHPGLGGITGYAGMLPSLPKGEAAKAEQKLETFKGKIKALGRTIASQQGKLGNMAVQEWQMVSDAVQAIKPTAGNLDEQMRDVVRQAKQLAKNMQDKFDLTYEEPPTAGGAPKPAGVGGKPAPTVSNW